MVTLNHKDLLKAGVHLGHLSRKWNPHMAPFIFMESHGIHIIDLNKTIVQLQEATTALHGIARSGKKILFVATKKQAKELVTHTAKNVNMPYMTERWLGGTLTNFITVRKLVKKLSSMDRMMKSASYKNMAKKEQLMLSRDKAKLERDLGGILDLTKLPGALVVVDVMKEHIAVQEANKLGIPVIALVDTNVNPNLVDYPVPSNDDATPAIQILMQAMETAIAAGLSMRQEDKLTEVHSASEDDDLQESQTGDEDEEFLKESTESDTEGYRAVPKGAQSKPAVMGSTDGFKRNRPKDVSSPQGAASRPSSTNNAHRPRKRMTDVAVKSTSGGGSSYNRVPPRTSAPTKAPAGARDFRAKETEKTK
jgi:small subunit ribosomal protein S2